MLAERRVRPGSAGARVYACVSLLPSPFFGTTGDLRLPGRRIPGRRGGRQGDRMRTTRLLRTAVLGVTALALAVTAGPIAAEAARRRRRPLTCASAARPRTAPRRATPSVTSAGEQRREQQRHEARRGDTERVRSRRPPVGLQAAGSTAGAGQTVAIVDAYDDPNAEADLAVYRAQYGLPACTTANGCFKKVNQTGGTTLPRPTAAGPRRSPSTWTWSRRSARTATSCSSRRPAPP